MKSASFARVMLDLFPGREMWLLAGVFAVGLASAAAQTLGVASILPFMTLVLDPTALERYRLLAIASKAVGATSPREALLFLGLATAAVVALGNAAAAMDLFAQERFAARTISRLSTALLTGYLEQPYCFHVQRDAPSLMKVVAIDVRMIVAGVVRPFLLGITRAFVAIGLLSLLFLHDPMVALLVALVLGLAYCIVFHQVRVRLRQLGLEMNQANLDRQRVLQESLGGVKDLQILGRESHVLQRFRVATSASALAEASNRITAAMPRYVLETVAFGGILLVTLALLTANEKGALGIVPVLALYAFAGYRLLPALQQVFASAVTIRFHQPVLRELHQDVVAVTSVPRLETSPAPEVHFTDAIRLEKVSFTYPGRVAPSLQGIDLVIRPRQSIGLVGQTGAGKTTLADIILGLYEPDAGSLTVDGVLIHGTATRAWRRRVGYVPQHVFLANASVTENIAFALAPEAIDQDAVRRAAQMAQADEFVGALPQGFDTLVGERGVKLSGGQRQRIGIARALYHEPEVLVFDEATSALDGLTEDAVMEAIRSLSGQRTIVLIAHRLRTVEACDRIVMLRQGRIIASGTYRELLESSDDFRLFVGRTPAQGMERVA